MPKSHAKHIAIQGHSQGHLIFLHSWHSILVTNKHIHIFIIHIYQCMNKVMVRLVGPISEWHLCCYTFLQALSEKVRD